MNLYQEYIHLSRYARFNQKEARRETFQETVDRYIDFLRATFPTPEGGMMSEYLERSREAIMRLDLMPSMRALMTAGPALARDNIAAFNCAYLPIDCPRAFDEVLYILMCGTGVGFSVERFDVDKLPEVPDLHPSDTVIVASDSKIGWAVAFRQLICLLYAGHIPKWNLSGIRKAGSVLKTFGGRASGPEPLDSLFKHTVSYFTNASGRKLRPIEVHDIICHIGKCVVVGGVRRSALISLSDVDDRDMRLAKGGVWWDSPQEGILRNGQRALANNSAVYESRPSVAQFINEWGALVESGSGERGIFNRNAVRHKVKESGLGRDPNYRWGTNPCLHPDSLVETIEGRKKIKDITAPTMVYTMLDDGSLGIRPCSASWVSRHSAATLVITINSGKQVRCTEDHEIYIVDKGWIAAKDVQIGDQVVHLVRDELKFNLSCKPYIVSIELGETTDVYDLTVEDTANFIVDFVVVHNCAEIVLRPQGLCNLTEVVVREDDDYASLKTKVELATVLGTLQSMLINFRYVRRVWQKNAEEERLLGVSLTGLMDHPVLSKTRGEASDWLKDFRLHARQINKVVVDYMSKLDYSISLSVAITTVKPSGTVSQLVDSASGIHARHSEYYLRAVRADSKDPLTKFMVDSGFPSEPDSQNPLDIVVFFFPIKSPEGSVVRGERLAVEELEHAQMVRDAWCDHNVSQTVSVKEGEWLDVGACVYKNFDSIAGVSFLPYTDHIYKQAPYTEISKVEYELWQNRMPKFVDWSLLKNYESEDYTVGVQELSCSSGVCDL